MRRLAASDVELARGEGESEADLAQVRDRRPAQRETGQQDRYTLVFAPAARRQLTQKLPEAVAFAAHAFIVGTRLDTPHRVGKRLHPPLDDRHSARRGTYRVIYPVDDEQHIVTVVGIAPRRDPYRSSR